MSKYCLYKRYSVKLLKKVVSCMLKYFYIFIIYSVIGWFMEVVIVSSKKRKVTARGFLIGPWCPIYGFGALFITVLLRKYYEDPIALFVMSFLIGTILEYVTSYLMEKMFYARWWDYSDHRFQINGRVSLTTSLGFGLLGLILVYVFNPFFLRIIKNIPPLIFNVIIVIVLLFFITDVIVSFRIISNIKKESFANLKDVTEKATMEIQKAIKDKSIFNRRLLNSFPHLKFILNQKRSDK